MAKPEKEPETELGKRLKLLRKKSVYGDQKSFAAALGFSQAALSNYENGLREPTAAALAAYSRVTGVSLDWLLTGMGNTLYGGDIEVADTSLAHVRKVIYNVAFSVAGKDLRRVKPKPFAEEFLGLFDYLMTLDERDEKSAEKVIDFGAERLTRASDQGEL
ncbi:MAG: helix-turn-helix transcriptional regulator [Roseibium sp.]|uniref:helix-turn-helix domain-containing protein n=2 Tax=Stappiaceae TaxID=2821832 RepID=UPI003266916A